MNMARNIMLMGCTRFASKKNWVESGTNLRVAANKLLSSRLTGIPVIENKDSRKVIGVVSELNLLGMFRDGRPLDNYTADNIMSRVPRTAEIDTAAEELIDIMLDNKFTMIPITRNNRLVGVVDRCSIIDFYMSPSVERYMAASFK